MSETVHDAIRDQLIEAMADAMLPRWLGIYTEETERQLQRRARPGSHRDAVRALDALLALRDSDGIPLVLGLIARPVVLSGGHYPDEGGPTVWVPRLSGGAA